jgi:hypothetical protein
MEGNISNYYISINLLLYIHKDFVVDLSVKAW